jgi:hypothetical protein
MWIATRQVEIVVQVANGPASLGQLIAVVTSCGTEVLAACSYWDRSGAVVMLVTENALRATHALEAAGFKCKSDSIVLIEAPDKPGLAAFLGQKLAAAGVNVLYSYAFRSDRDQSYVVFKTTDDERAIYLLELEALIYGLATTKSWRRSDRAARRAAVLDVEVEHAEPQAA